MSTKSTKSSKPNAKSAASYNRGISTLEHETVLANLPVQGVLPAWLQGALVRNGPAKFESWMGGGIGLLFILARFLSDEIALLSPLATIGWSLWLAYTLWAEKDDRAQSAN